MGCYHHLRRMLLPAPLFLAASWDFGQQNSCKGGMKTENSLFQQQQSWLPLLQCLDSSHCLASPVGVFVSQGVGLAKTLLSKPVFLSEFVQISLFSF